ncbi:MAG: hypothetical protein PHS02_00335 [Candidatus ainarchaeum sp.]|nr:hypothetical protein [Candidatus ainarchaeum sp.]
MGNENQSEPAAQGAGANDKALEKKGGLPLGLMAIAIVALAIGFVMANPGTLSQLAGASNANINANPVVANLVSAPNSGAQASAGSANGQAALAQGAQPSGDVQEIRMDVLASGWSPDSFVLKKGVKTRWVINAKQLTGCNQEIKVPDYGLDIKLQQGENIVEFTPDKEGVVRWSCWMGMIRGTFVVVNDTGNQSAVSQALANAPAPKTGGCGCGG